MNKGPEVKLSSPQFNDLSHARRGHRFPYNVLSETPRSARAASVGGPVPAPRAGVEMDDDNVESLGTLKEPGNSGESKSQSLGWSVQVMYYREKRKFPKI